MTMSTSIYVQQPVSPERLFRHLQAALSDRPQRDYHRLPGQPYVRENGTVYESPGHADRGEWGNRIGQGLPAILQVEYGAGGPLAIDHWDCQSHPEYCECSPGEVHDLSPLRRFEPLCLKVWIDTAYGYRAANGASCGDLHAYMVATVADWLANQPGDPGFVWSNGETDIASDTLDRLHELGDPVKGCPFEFASR